MQTRAFLPNDAAKAAVGAVSFNDAGTQAAFEAISVAWLEALRSSSVFDALWPDMRSAPMHQRFAISTLAVVADEISEGAGIPVKSMSLSASEPLRPKNVSSIIVTSRELARLTESEAWLDSEMRNAVSAGTDKAFLDGLLALATPIASTGTIADLDAMLASVPLSTQSRLHWVFSPQALKMLATERGNGVAVWPGVDATGGAIYGLPVHTSDQLPAGVAMLIDAASIAGNRGSVELSTSTQTSLQMADPSTQSAVHDRRGEHDHLVVPGQRGWASRNKVFRMGSVAARGDRGRQRHCLGRHPDRGTGSGAGPGGRTHDAPITLARR